MSSRSLVTVAVLLASALAFPGQLMAQDAAGQAAVEKRLNIYREIGAANKNMRDELAIPMPDAAKIKASAEEIVLNMKGMPTWFPEGSGRPEDNLQGFDKIKAMFGFGPQKPKSFNPMRTRAKPEVWSEKAELDAIFTNKMVPAANKMVEVAAGGDIAAIKVQLEELGKVCTECHTKFRYEQDE